MSMREIFEENLTEDKYFQKPKLDLLLTIL